MGMHGRRMVVAVTAAWLMVPSALGATTIVVEFPDPGLFYGNATFAVDGNVAYVPTYDNDALWSFSLETGGLLDPDGLALPAPGTASDAFVFPGARVVVPGWFPGQGLFVADVSDPTNLSQLGIISFPGTTNIQGQNVEVDENGYIGYVAGFPDDTLYSFNVSTLSLEDPDGLALPGNPDRIGLAGDRVAMVDTTNGRIMVADVSDPANMTLAGVIELPGTNTFGSNDNIVFADDGQTGFVTNNECILYSFDVLTLSLSDPDGIFVGGTQLHGGNVAIHGDTVACLYSRGLTFVDVSDPTNMSIISSGQFGGTIAPSGTATVAFTADGTKAAMPVVYPGDLIYTFYVATGEQVSDPYSTDPHPYFLTIYGPDDRVGTLIANGDARVWLISGLFDVLLGDLNCDGEVNAYDIDGFICALSPQCDYERLYPDCDRMLADCNGDGEVNAYDIDSFIALVGGG